jgi:ABC-2 type transport system ATP-binding protein
LDPFTQGSEVRERTGVLTETPALYERLTARQNLVFFATLDGMSQAEARSRSDATLRLFDLTDRADNQVGSFSKGMKQRLALGRALLSDPALLFLDEPTSGLDPEAARGVHDLIRNMRAHDGHSLLLCPHHLEEAEALCDRVAILNRGSLVALGTLDELRRDAEPGLRVKVITLQPFAITSSGRLPGALEVSQENPTHIVVRIQAEDAVPSLVDALVQKGARILSVQPLRPSLADIYFKLQGEQPESTKKVQ